MDVDDQQQTREELTLELNQIGHEIEECRSFIQEKANKRNSVIVIINALSEKIETLTRKESRRKQLDMLTERAMKATKTQREAAAAIQNTLTRKKKKKPIIGRKKKYHHAPIASVSLPTRSTVPYEDFNDLASIFYRLVMRHEIQYRKPNINWSQLTQIFKDYIGEEMHRCTDAKSMEMLWPTLFQAVSEEFVSIRRRSICWRPFEQLTYQLRTKESVMRAFEVERSLMEEIYMAAAGVMDSNSSLKHRFLLELFASNDKSRLLFVPNYYSNSTSIVQDDHPLVQLKESKAVIQHQCDKPYDISSSILQQIDVSGDPRPRLDPMRILCKFETSGGTCNDENCEYQHVRDGDSTLIQTTASDMKELCQYLDRFQSNARKLDRAVLEDEDDNANAMIVEIDNSDGFLQLSPIEEHANFRDDIRYFQQDEVNCLKEIINENPQDVAAWIRLAKCEANLDTALQYLSSALELNPGSEDIWMLYLLYFRRRTSSTNHLVQMIEEALKCVPSSYTLWSLFLDTSKPTTVNQRISQTCKAIEQLADVVTSEQLMHLLTMACDGMVKGGYAHEALRFIYNCLTNQEYPPYDTEMLGQKMDRGYGWLICIDLCALQQIRCRELNCPMSYRWDMTVEVVPYATNVCQVFEQAISDTLNDRDDVGKIVQCNFATYLFKCRQPFRSICTSSPLVRYHLALLYLETMQMDKADALFPLQDAIDDIELIYYYYMYYYGWSKREYAPEAINIIMDWHNVVANAEDQFKLVSHWLNDLSESESSPYVVLALSYVIFQQHGLSATTYHLDRILNASRFQSLDVETQRQFWLDRIRFQLLEPAENLDTLVQTCLSTIPASTSFEMELYHLHRTRLKTILYPRYTSPELYMIELSHAAYNQRTTAMKNVLHAFPGHPKIVQLAIGIALSQCRVSRALRHIHKAIIADPLNAEFYRMALQLYCLAGLDVDDIAQKIEEVGVVIGHDDSTINDTLSHQCLTLVPQQIFMSSPSTLLELDVSRNCLTILPEAIHYLSGLQILNVAYNSLIELPDTISQMNQLVSLNAAHNQIQEIPTTFHQLTQLVELNFNSNLISEVPASLGQLTQLKKVFLAFNNLSMRQVKSVITHECDLNLQGNLAAASGKVFLHHTLGPCVMCRASTKTQSFNSMILCAECIITALRTEM